MMRRTAVVTLGLLSVVLPARAGEIVEFKGAVLVRQEERAMMVFKVKNGEIKAQPSPGMKGVDLNGKVYSSSFAAAEKKEHALQLLKVGNEFDIKINKVNAKTSYIAEVRLVKGEMLESGTRNKVEKGDAKANDPKAGARPEDKNPGARTDATKPDNTQPGQKARLAKSKAEKHSYSKAVIKTYENKMVTFEVDGEEITAELSNSFKATDRGRVLRKDERFRVFKEGNVAMIGTTKTGKKEVITDIRVTRGSLADK